MSERFHQPADVPAIERRRRFRRGRRTLWVDQESRRRLPGFVSRRAATDAAAYEGRCLRQGLLDKTNTAGGVWADIAYRSAANETFLNKSSATSIARSQKAALRPRRCGGPKSQIENPLACRACVRGAKGSDGAIHQNYRDRPSNGQDRNGQSRLQHQRFIFLRKIAVA
jgi:hypothetical protein